MKKAAAPRSTPAGEALVAMLLAAGHVLQDLDAACQEQGITHDQYNLLRILRGAPPEGHPRGEISARMIARAPDVTRMIDRLESRGLVGRSWHPENRRLSMARITDDGAALLAQLDSPIQRVHAKYAEGVSATDLQTLRRVCNRMLE